MTSETDLRTLIEFIDEYGTEEELTSPTGVRAILDGIEEDLKVIKILKNHPRIFEFDVKRYGYYKKIYNVYLVNERIVHKYEYDLIKEYFGKKKSKN